MRITDITSLAGMFLVIGLLLAAAWQGPLKPIARCLTEQPLYAAASMPTVEVQPLADKAGAREALTQLADLSR